VRGAKRIVPLLLVAVAAVGAAGCGGDEEGKPIPVATADQLDAQLDDVQARLDQGSVGACKDILEAPESRGADQQQVQDVIDSMPDDVDSDIKSALQDSFDHLWDLVEQECEDKESKQETETNTTPTETQEETTPTETQEETTPTETQEETTPTTTTPTDEELLPNDGNGESGGGAGPSSHKKEKKK
jgi:hypothetical protein